jgi:hypothetical protein
MEPRTAWEADNLSSDEETPWLLCKTKVNYRVHRRSPLELSHYALKCVF